MSLRDATPRAPARPPLVIPLMLAILALQAVCLPALPVLFLAGGLIRWRGWRPGWIALGALAVLIAEAAWIGPDLLMMHFAGWTQFSVDHPFQVIVPRLITETPVGIPLGILLGALVLAHGEHTAAGAEWHPATQRRHAREQARTGRQLRRQLQRHREDPTFPQLGVLLEDLGLTAWVIGRYVIVPADLRGLGQVVIGMPGMGKTVTLLRLVYLAAKQGRQVIFLDCKGTDPSLPDWVIAAYTPPTPTPASSAGPTSRSTSGAAPPRRSPTSCWAPSSSPPTAAASGTATWPPAPPNSPSKPPPAHPAAPPSSWPACTPRPSASCGSRPTTPPPRRPRCWTSRRSAPKSCAACG
jgi:hypothetical protein